VTPCKSKRREFAQTLQLRCRIWRVRNHLGLNRDSAPERPCFCYLSVASNRRSHYCLRWITWHKPGAYFSWRLPRKLPRILCEGARKPDIESNQCLVGPIVVLIVASQLNAAARADLIADLQHSRPDPWDSTRGIPPVGVVLR
jgi:hypothetical protein